MFYEEDAARRQTLDRRLWAKEEPSSWESASHRSEMISEGVRDLRFKVVIASMENRVIRKGLFLGDASAN